MTGETLKKILNGMGMPLAEIAKRLEMSPQHLNQALSASDVKSGFIEKICKEFGYPINFFYEVKDVQDSNIITNSTEVSCTNQSDKLLIAEMAAQREAYTKQIDQLTEIIKKLTNK